MSLLDQFKDALGSWASGVTVVTTRVDDLLYGLTVSSFGSVSLHPPLVSVCINNGNRAAGMIERSHWFAVSLLGAGHAGASDYFARSGREPTEGFVEIDGELTDSGLPIVRGAMAYVVCDVVTAVPAGDHTLFVGRVTSAGSDPTQSPLVYWRRRYRSLVEPGP